MSTERRQEQAKGCLSFNKEVHVRHTLDQVRNESKISLRPCFTSVIKDNDHTLACVASLFTKVSILLRSLAILKSQISFTRVRISSA